MGNLVYLNKQLEGVAQYLDSGVSANGLVKGVDFEVASIFLMDNTYAAYSLGGFLKITSNELFRDTTSGFLKTAKELVKGKNIEGISETPLPTDDNLAFYKVKGTIDIDLATEIGLGVVKCNNEYMLYSPFYGEDANDAVYEMLLLKVYFQLLHPEHIDEKLAINFGKYADLIESYIIVDKRKHMKSLLKILTGV